MVCVYLLLTFEALILLLRILYTEEGKELSEKGKRNSSGVCGSVSQML